MPKGKKAKLFALLALLAIASCEKTAPQHEQYGEQVEQALKKIGENRQSIVLPKVPYPVSPLARMAAVDKILASPLSSIDLGQALKDVKYTGARSEYVATVLQHLDLGDTKQQPVRSSVPQDIEAVWGVLSGLPPSEAQSSRIPTEWREDPALARVLLAIGRAIIDAKASWSVHGGQPSAAEMEAIHAHMAALISYSGDVEENILLTEPAYHVIGKRVNVAELAAALQRLFSVVESVLPTLQAIEAPAGVLDWETPLGKVRIAGKGNDTHEGSFLLLIDLGGDDTYVDVGSAPQPGNITVVIDLDGNDQVHWQNQPGPGAGVFGMGLWLDLSGNDQYRGSNLGLGAALMGAGIFWDDKGDDSYDAGFLSQGAGQYGVGVFVDALGNDRYASAMAGQGFGGPGGVGMLADLAGNDKYTCGGVVPDRFAARVSRHLDKHFLSMCQGYAFGLRPDISGGIGLLLDSAGDDKYVGDIFAQGGAYWFGLGMLVDGSGNDSYEAFEHCQGASLHLGAGFLGDWDGNDEYQGYEHCQGVGMDRASGVLYDRSGDDAYRSHYESQGAGLKTLGVGILIDREGKDRYEALRDAQGYAKPEKGAPDSDWPIGVLLDLHGEDTFVQPYTDAVDSAGRIQERKGIAIDR